jgi:hypothetical protein
MKIISYKYKNMYLNINVDDKFIKRYILLKYLMI